MASLELRNHLVALACQYLHTRGWHQASVRTVRVRRGKGRYRSDWGLITTITTFDWPSRLQPPPHDHHHHFWYSAHSACFPSFLVCSCNCKCSWIFPCWRHSPPLLPAASFPPFLTGGDPPLPTQCPELGAGGQLGGALTGSWSNAQPPSLTLFPIHVLPLSNARLLLTTTNQYIQMSFI